MNPNLKYEADALMRIPGKVRGEVILNRLNFIADREGQGAVLQIEKNLNDLGYPMDFKAVSSLEWLSEAHGFLIVIIAKEIFGWDVQAIYDMGVHSPKVSFMVKLFMNIVSMETTFKSAPASWSKHHSVGRLEPAEYNEKGKVMVLRLYDFKFHPLYCLYLRGYFFEIARLIIYKGRNTEHPPIAVAETKCTFKGDEYDEFRITW
jgi:hypothetical protein